MAEEIQRRLGDGVGPVDGAVVGVARIGADGKGRFDGRLLRRAERQWAAALGEGGDRAGRLNRQRSVAHIDIGEGDGAAVGQRRALGDGAGDIDNGNDGRIVGAGEGDSDGLEVSQRHVGVVRGFDGVFENQRLAVGQVVEGLGAGVEVPGQCVGGLRAVEDGCRREAEHGQQCGIARRRRIKAVGGAADGERIDRGGDQVGGVDVADRQCAGAGESGIGLGQRDGVRSVADGRCVVSAV